MCCGSGSCAGGPLGPVRPLERLGQRFAHKLSCRLLLVVRMGSTLSRIVQACGECGLHESYVYCESHKTEKSAHSFTESSHIFMQSRDDAEVTLLLPFSANGFNRECWKLSR